MVDVVKNNLDKIITACKEHRIKSLYLFGSAAREQDFSNDNDVDFLYEFQKGISAQEYADNYFDLLSKLEKLFRRKIDFVPAGRSRNKYFIQSIDADKIKLYEA